MTKKINIVLFSGGDSSEREVSISSGDAVYKAIKDNKTYNITRLDPRDNLKEFEIMVKNNQVDVAFLALHGTKYEDGQFQDYLDKLSVKYTGAGAMASRIGFDKIAMKKVWHNASLPVAQDIILIKNENQWAVGSTDMDEASTVKSLEDGKKLISEIVKGYFKFPLFIKPSQEGSSVGVYMIKTQTDLDIKIDELSQKYDRIIIEEKLEGVEVTIPFFYNRDLQVTEISPEGEEFYNFDSKYKSGGSKHVIPAKISPQSKKALFNAVNITLKALEVDSYCRIDAFVDGDNWKLTELNTLPGMTSTSLLPEAVKESGLDFSGMCNRIISGSI